MTTVKKKEPKVTEAFIIIESQYVQKLAKKSIKRALTREELQRAEDAMYGFGSDDANEPCIDDLIRFAIGCAVDSNE